MRFSNKFLQFALFSQNREQTGSTPLSSLSARPKLLVSGLFTPGVLLVAVGVLTILFPRFFITIVATFLLMVGFLLCFVAWKFMQLKNQVTKMAKNLEGKLQVKAYQVRRSDLDVIEVDENNKIIYH